MRNNQSDLPPRSDRHISVRGKKGKNLKKDNSLFKDIISTLLYIAFLFGAFFIIHRYFYAPVVVDGDSMEPTLSHGDYLILNKYSDYEQFDIVVFTPPIEDEMTEDDEETLFIKRVIGVPGDAVEYRDDALFINGEEIEENFLEHSSEDETFYSSGNFSLEKLWGVNEVPAGQYFVLGDNRFNSKDSRNFGFIDEESIIGEVSLRYWPFEKIGWID